MKKIFIFLFLFFIIFLNVILLYFLDYYKPLDEAYEYLESSDNVNVIKTNNYYFFDGPGKDKAIIFYPGAKVDAKSYSELMYKLSLNGIDSFLIKMPLNFAFFGINNANNIIDNYEYDNYYLAGHSLGGVAASMYLDSNKSIDIKGIIFLASYPTSKIDDDINVISIYGENDKILNMDKYNDSKKYFSNNYKELVIEDGNHALFGLYGKQKGDGLALISSDEHIDETVKFIINNV